MISGTPRSATAYQAGGTRHRTSRASSIRIPAQPCVTPVITREATVGPSVIATMVQNVVGHPIPTQIATTTQEKATAMMK